MFSPNGTNSVKSIFMPEKCFFALWMRITAAADV